MSEPTPDNATQGDGKTDEARFVEVDFDPFAGAEISSVIPTTEAQREVWLADQLDPMASLAYNESVTIALHGTIDPDAMRTAIAGLTRRHDVLRAALSHDGSELLIQQDTDDTLIIDDLSSMSTDEADDKLSELVANESAVAFDLVNGPLFRARLISLSADEHALVLGAHHIVCDGFSFAILIRDLATLYRSAVSCVDAALPAADSFADYAAGLAAGQAQSDQVSADEQYWLTQFSESMPPALDLPTSQARTAQRSFASARLDLPVSPDLVRQIRQLAGQTRSGAFAVLLTGFATLLARLSNQQDLVIGIPSAGQSTVESDSLVGHCVNLLPVRLPVVLDQNAGEAIAQVQQKVFEAFDNQRYTYGSLLKKLPVDRDPSRPTLVSVMFNLDQALDGADLDFGGPSAEILSNPRKAENFELFLNISQTRDHMTLECQYNTDLFDEATIRLWLSGYRALLGQMADTPDQPLAILDIIGEQQAQAIARLNDTAAELPQHTNIGQWLSLSARNHLEQPALTATDPNTGELETLRYAQLEGFSNQLARALRQRAIGRGKTVGICLPRDARMIVAQWAVLKSGAAYVPLDPAYPKDRLTMMAQDAGIELVISTLNIVGELDLGIGEVILLDAAAEDLAELPAGPLARSPLDAGLEDPAYLIYTSGSTGRPKGVRVPHRAVLNFLGTMAKRPGLTEHDRLLAVTTLSFDIAVLELLLPAVTGAQIILADAQTTRDGAALLQLLNDTDATVMQATPSTWRLLIDAGLQEKRNLKALVGGEAFPPELSAPLLRLCGSVWNLYGPTETTVWSTIWRVRKPGAPIRIGRPIGNTQIYVLDERGQPCPIGVPGEIIIGGAGVALGYHNQPLLTTERFIADTYSGQQGRRLYRTGDLGRWTWTGDLEHLGRLDHQVKLRGFRIELGEIEANLQQLEGVRQALVVTYEKQADDTRLVAYLVSEHPIDASAMRTELQRTLPDYMVPQHFVQIDEMPLLNNGKVNRKALPAPEDNGTASQPAGGGRAASTDLERSILATMAEVLGRENLGVQDDFFTVGGHSILAARVITRLNESLSLKLPMRTIFEAPSAGQLAARIAPLTGENADTENAADSDTSELIVSDDQTSGPLTPMQERVLFVEQMSPDRVIYNVPSAHRLTGPIDLKRFETALASVVARQSGLRTVIDISGKKPVQRVLDTVPVRLPLTDLSEVESDRRELTLHRKLDSLIAQTFDLHEGPLFKGAMIRLAPDEHVFFFMAHHIIWDGWSFDVLYDEMAQAYGAESPAASAAPPLAVSYIDFARWQQQFLNGPQAQEEIDFWTKRLTGQPKPEALPADHQRSGQRTGEGETVWIEISDGLTERLREMASRTGTTLNMLMLAAYSLLMSDMASDKQIVVGMPMRGREKPEFESLTGFFNNMLPLHLRPRPELPFTDWLNHVRHEVIDILAHQSVPFERLATAVNDASLLDYQVLFSFQDARERTRHWGDLEHENIPVFQRGATEDLGLWLLDGNSGLKGGITYNTDLYDRDTARELRQRFSNLLRAIAKHPDMTIARLLPRMHKQAPAQPDVGVIDDLPGIAPASAAEPTSKLSPDTSDEPDFTPVDAFEDTFSGPTLPDNSAFDPLDHGPDTDSELMAGGSEPLNLDLSLPDDEPTGFDPLSDDISDARLIEPVSTEPDPISVTSPHHEESGRTASELKLADIWADVLGLTSGAEIERDDNFFDMGGTSLQAMQVMERIEKLTGHRGNPRLMVFGSLRQLAVSYLANAGNPDEASDNADQDADLAAGNSPGSAGDTGETPAGSGRGFFGRLFKGR